MAASENAELEELIRQATGGSETVPPAGQSPVADAEEEGGDSLDLSILVMVARRSLPWVLLLIALGFTGSWLYLRYTKPVYKASSVLKIDEQSNASVLGLGLAAEKPNSTSNQLAGEVELIKSGITYSRIKKKIPLDVNYYTKGTVLENELFASSPFKVEYSLSDDGYYNKRFNVEYLDARHYQLNVEMGGSTQGGRFAFGQLVQLPGLSLRLLPTSEKEGVAQGLYHFTLLDNGSIDSYLNQNLAVEVVNPSANTIQISFTDNNRVKAMTIVNALDSVYLDAKLERKSEASAKIQKYLDETLKQTGRSLERAEDSLSRFALRNKTYDAKGEIATLLAKLDALTANRLLLEQNQDLLDNVSTLADQQRLTTREDQTVAQNLPELNELQDPVLLQQLEQLNQQQVLLARYKRSYREPTEAIKIQEAELATIQQNVRRQLGRVRKSLQRKLGLLDEQVAKVQSRLGQLPGLATQQARLNRPLELYTGAVSSMMQARLNYQIQSAGTTPDFQILSPAGAPSEPISPKKLLVYAIGLAGGLVLGLGLIAVRYLMHNTVTSVSELERNTKASVLGVIPTYTKEEMSVSRLVVDKNPKASVSEAIRSIRTNLDFISPANKKRLISITSTISGEGKTFVAVNLAGIIALSGQRVVILDLDMRKPKVNLAFGAENVRGVSTILIDRHTVAECIQHTSIEALDFISAGPTPPNPSELILSPRFDEMLQELHRSYDVIMIDTPPVGLVTDGILIMRKADVPIYIVRAGYSRKTFLKNLNRLMRNNQFGRMCTILNDAQTQGSYGYGYGTYGMGYYEEPETRQQTFGQRLKKLFS